MATLIAMRYPTEQFANAADHTYVQCGTGGKAWACWGGKSGGNELRSGTGSTKRADRIAQPDEKARIKCYLVNGVCHQCANRVLLPAGITVRGARGYSISEALYGTYGRVGRWPCKSDFKTYADVTGDLPECVLPGVSGAAVKPVLTATDKLDWHYIKGVLKIYDEARSIMKHRAAAPAKTKALNIKLFMFMAEFHLGPMLDKKLRKKLKKVRGKTENQLVKAEKALHRDMMKPGEIVDVFNKITLDFQDEMADIMKPEQYETLFDLKPEERVVLADPEIVAEVFGDQ